MKKMRRFAAIAAAAAMTACMAVPMMSMMTASAAQDTITIAGATAGTHEYTVYKVFSGTVKEGTTTLEGIDWAMTDSEDFLTALKNDPVIGSEFSTETTAAAVAKTISGFGDKSAEAKAFAAFVANYAEDNGWTGPTGSDTITVAEDGYYVIVETTFTPAGDTPVAEGAYTAHILGVYDASEGANITAKSGAPSVIKKVEENVKNVTAEGETFAGTDDYDVGAQYNDVADYCIGDAVSFKLYGTLPTELAQYSKYKYVFHDTLDSQFTPPTEENVKVYIDGQPTDAAVVDVNENNITVTFNDIIAAGATSSSIVTVEYDAVLSKDAEIGKDGQMNAVYLTYSNNPNWVGTGADDYPNDEGRTPEDKVIVFTYELDVTKVDGANTNTKLAGAEFKLSNADNKFATVDADGILTGWVDNIDDATTLTSDDSGVFKVVGLDDGTYKLKEIKAPEGYNLLTADVEVKITATTKNDQVWDDFDADTALTELKIDVTQGTATTNGTGDLDDGIVGATITNNSGSTLPSTGGIGTTLFYVIGGTLAAGAGVSLIAKKRMKNED